MQLSATLTTAELRSLAHSLLPLRVDLRAGDDDELRWLDVTEPVDARLIADECIALSARAAIRWPERALFDEFNVERVELRLEPRVEPTDDGAAIVVDVRFGALELGWVPDFVSEAVVHAINRRLESTGDQLRWDVTGTLSVRFAQTGERSNIEQVCLDLRTAKLSLSDESVRLEAPMTIGVRHGRPEELAERLAGT